ncbi:MAG: hypothetical protein O7D95_06530 [Betaproteobacteria bacterium]|nr:hypothetical protein [Betaproteobacteria bacterium]
MASNVKHVNFGDKLDPRIMLRQLAEDDDLKGCVTICMWGDDTITCGWSNMTVSSVALASLKLQVDIMKEASTND